jgi:hypothetical protein
LNGIDEKMKIGSEKHYADSIQPIQDSINNAIKQKQIEFDLKRKNDLIEEYGQTIGIGIYYNRITIGMNKEMIIDILGEPKDINRDIGSWGVHEQWVYEKKYLYFENGILTSWQD